MLREWRSAAAEGARSDELAELISGTIARVVAHDAMSLVGSSPSRLLAASFSLWCGDFSTLGDAIVRRYYAHEPPLIAAEKARNGAPTLATAAGGARLRRLLATRDTSDELWLNPRDSRGSWGWLALFRAGGGRPFDQDDQRRLAPLGPVLAAFLRGHVTDGPLVPVVPALPAGVIVVSADDRLRITPQVMAWTERLAPYDRSPDWLGESVLVGMARWARRHAHDPDTPTPEACFPVSGTGRWVTWRAQQLDPDGAGDVAIVVQAATGAMLLPSFCDWYGITARERQIIAQLCEGAAPKQIARRLDLSPYTVNDHLKSVFRKTGAGGRDQLIAALTV